MIEKLERLYKTELSFPVLLFGKRKIMFFIFICLDLCLILGGLTLWLLEFKVYAWICLFIFTIIFICYFWLAKTLLRLKYNIKTAFIPDFYKAVKNLRKNILKNFLIAEEALDNVFAREFSG